MFLIPLVFVLLIPILAELCVKYNYKKYMKVSNALGVTGAEVAQQILERNSLDTVKVKMATGSRADCYKSNKGRKAVCLSPDVFEESSLAALAIAAHECGHALQDKEGYMFMNMRNALSPLVSGVNYLAYICLAVSFFLPFFGLGWLAVLALFSSLAFQMFTLPVEFNASKRALAELKSMGLVEEDELAGVRSLLTCAAWTYVAAVASTCVQLLRVLAILRRR